MDLAKTIDELADELASVLNQQPHGDWVKITETWAGRAISQVRHAFEANKEVHITSDKEHRVVAYDQATGLWVVRKVN